jgi:hypothetical protein
MAKLQISHTLGVFDLIYTTLLATMAGKRFTNRVSILNISWLHSRVLVKLPAYMSLDGVLSSNVPLPIYC